MRAAAAVLLAGLLLGQASTPSVRTRTNDGLHCLHWPVAAGARGQLTWVQSSAGDPVLGAGALDAVTRSGQTWETQLQACGDLDLVEGTRSSSRSIGYLTGGPNENLTLFRSQLCSSVVPGNDPCVAANTCANAYDCWDHPADTVALTTTTYQVATGALLDADVEINAASATPTIVDSPPCAPSALSTSCVANDVQNAMTHELGHFLGLAHSPDPSSTMYASEPIGETSKRVLDPGSKQFVCDVYPQGQASQDCGASSGGTTGGTSSSGCSSAPGGGPLAPGWLLLAILVHRRRCTPSCNPAGEAVSEGGRRALPHPSGSAPPELGSPR
ncbi:MAG TPA: myxosortase-dependent metalloprotease, MXAN_2677/MXAN_2678 family [Myxococcaceae bacterium]|nr:myxosortase-dependent metalloprotease, MXAN_2677/MXAN_2678 family [Myxococcaceae bacterium]